MLYTSIFFITIFVLWYVNLKLRYRGTEKIPGPRPLPILGNSMDLTSNNLGLLQNMLRLNRKYGSMFKMWFNSSELNVVVADAGHMEYILSTKNVVEKQTWSLYFREMLGEGVTISPGYKWRKQRKLIAPSFTGTNMKTYTTTINEQMNGLINIIKDEKENEQIDISVYVYRHSLAIICHTMLYLSCSSKVIENFTNAFNNCLSIIMKRHCSAFLRHEFIFKLTNLSKQQSQWTQILHDTINSLIQKRMNERSQQIPNMKRTFLDHLLDATEANSNFSDINISDELICILLAGYETTATAVSYCIYELSKHPDIQLTLLEEINDTLQGNEISYELLLKMYYLDRVFKETLRLYPPVPIIDRMVTEPLTLGEHKIPENTTCTFFIYGIHHDETVYPEPDVFDPDRFLPENVQRRHSHSFVPFAAGRRDCLGKKYAIVQAKVMIINIVRKFEICEGDPSHKPILSAETSLKCLNGLPVRLKSRK